MAHRLIDINALADVERDGIVKFAVHLDPSFEDVDEFFALVVDEFTELACAVRADACQDRDHALLAQVGAQIMIIIIVGGHARGAIDRGDRSEEHTSELQSLMRISYAVFCLKKKKKHI